MKQILMSMSATPWLASLRADDTAVLAAGGRGILAPITMPAMLGLAASGERKLRQEKTAHVQVRLGAAAFAAYGTTGMGVDQPAALGRRVPNPQTTSTANGGVQGPQPWRQPVTT
ncbi:hypothetical protein [Sphaerisporangium fuscum]|uniref:hypothetical protein n=1 Tax=Sphaerisporangium fuscum TaxID=2835868 RepID=UPI001BDD7A3A|nr:hypothetical protein [Sphaerisporangium fuscum]